MALFPEEIAKICPTRRASLELRAVPASRGPVGAQHTCKRQCGHGASISQERDFAGKSQFLPGFCFLKKMRSTEWRTQSARIYNTNIFTSNKYIKIYLLKGWMQFVV